MSLEDEPAVSLSFYYSENCMVPINTTIVSMLNPQDNS